MSWKPSSALLKVTLEWDELGGATSTRSPEIDLTSHLDSSGDISVSTTSSSPLWSLSGVNRRTTNKRIRVVRPALNLSTQSGPSGSAHATRSFRDGEMTVTGMKAKITLNTSSSTSQSSITLIFSITCDPCTTQTNYLHSTVNCMCVPCTPCAAGLAELEPCGGDDGFQNTKCEVAPVWNDWSEWTPCSATCDGGMRKRTRKCMEGSCAGSTEAQSEVCGQQVCPVHGEWSGWRPAGECSKSCGPGTQPQVRACDNPAPAHGGSPCPGEDSGVRECNEGACVVPVNGEWGDWDTVGVCSKTCGAGTLPQTRACDNPAPANGGSACAGSAERDVECNLRDCPAPAPVAVAGGWGEWSDAGECSSSCGLGTLPRTRLCDNPAPSNGGAACAGSSQGSSDCNLGACPPAQPPAAPVEGNGDDNDGNGGSGTGEGGDGGTNVVVGGGGSGGGTTTVGGQTSSGGKGSGDDSTGPPWGIIGGAIGGVVVVALAIGFVVLALRRRDAAPAAKQPGAGNGPRTESAMGLVPNPTYDGIGGLSVSTDAYATASGYDNDRLTGAAMDAGATAGGVSAYAGLSAAAGAANASAGAGAGAGAKAGVRAEVQESDYAGVRVKGSGVTEDYADVDVATGSAVGDDYTDVNVVIGAAKGAPAPKSAAPDTMYSSVREAPTTYANVKP